MPTCVLRVLHHALVVREPQEAGQGRGPEGLEGLGEGAEQGLEVLEGVLGEVGEEGVEGVELEVGLEEERKDRLQTAVLMQLLEIVVIVVA